jgi:hypothetical protein
MLSTLTSASDETRSSLAPNSQLQLLQFRAFARLGAGRVGARQLPASHPPTRREGQHGLVTGLHQPGDEKTPEGESSHNGVPSDSLPPARHVSCKFRNFFATLVFWSGCGRGKTPANRHNALVAQWIEHRFPKPGVAGSIPAGGTSCSRSRLASRCLADVRGRRSRSVAPRRDRDSRTRRGSRLTVPPSTVRSIGSCARWDVEDTLATGCTSEGRFADLSTSDSTQTRKAARSPRCRCPRF